MTPGKLSLAVRSVAQHISIIDIHGDVTGAADSALTDAYTSASTSSTIILNFTALEYMNSSGIGLLVTLLIRAQRQGQRLLAFGLTEHYRDIFELTRLNEAITLFNIESDVLESLNISRI
ncbi:MAG: STAS domain-containing protein [Pleurocapsa minor GSE-CHR-MK-17-07R]|jgi:anti-sigma B factor antagonist|nr:STAS domain-containing protein [Pleurocapsa minor GSE-CHR-MK 17-07R]